MRGIKSNTFVDDFDPLTPTLSHIMGEGDKTVPLPERQGTWRGTPNFKYGWLAFGHIIHSIVIQIPGRVSVIQ